MCVVVMKLTDLVCVVVMKLTDLVYELRVSKGKEKEVEWIHRPPMPQASMTCRLGLASSVLRQTQPCNTRR